MEDPDNRLDVRHTADWWQQEYEHNLAHYRAGAAANFVCPGVMSAP